MFLWGSVCLSQSSFCCVERACGTKEEAEAPSGLASSENCVCVGGGVAGRSLEIRGALAHRARLYLRKCFNYFKKDEASATLMGERGQGTPPPSSSFSILGMQLPGTLAGTVRQVSLRWRRAWGPARPGCSLRVHRVWAAGVGQAAGTMASTVWAHTFPVGVGPALLLAPSAVSHYPVGTSGDPATTLCFAPCPICLE